MRLRSGIFQPSREYPAVPMRAQARDVTPSHGSAAAFLLDERRFRNLVRNQPRIIVQSMRGNIRRFPMKSRLPDYPFRSFRSSHVRLGVDSWRPAGGRQSHARRTPTSIMYAVHLRWQCGKLDGREMHR